MPFDISNGTAPTPAPFVLEDFFNGIATGTGFYQGRNGAIGRQMSCRIEGLWNAAEQCLTLNEEFWFVDGRYETRIWTIVKQAANDYRFTAGDIVGEGRGSNTQAGVFTSRYSLNYDLPNPVLGRSSMLFNFLDTMLGVDDSRMLNRSRMMKFGLWLGDITLWIERKTQRASLAPMASAVRTANQGGRVGRKN